MQNICILLSTLCVSIQLKSTRSALPDENQVNFDDRLRSLSEAEVLNDEDEESGFGSFKGSRDSEDPPYISNNEYQPFTDVQLIRYLLDRYLRKNGPHHETKEQEVPSKYTKRALTLLSRWKPFQIPNAIGGNRRHVIRSSPMSRTVPLNSKMQIMGWPFRWG